MRERTTWLRGYIYYPTGITAAIYYTTRRARDQTRDWRRFSCDSRSDMIDRRRVVRLLVGERIRRSIGGFPHTRERCLAPRLRRLRRRISTALVDSPLFTAAATAANHSSLVHVIRKFHCLAQRKRVCIARRGILQSVDGDASSSSSSPFFSRARFARPLEVRRDPRSSCRSRGDT